MLQHTITVIGTLAAMWIGSGISVGGIKKIAARLRKSSFFVSFFVLGLFTSLSEISVAINAGIDKVPQISLGNLLGGIILIFLFIIPVLAFLGKGIQLKHSLSLPVLFVGLLYLFMPFIFLVDSKLSSTEGGLLVLGYIALSFFIYRGTETAKSSLKPKSQKHLGSLFVPFIMIVVGIVTLFIASDFLLKEIVYFADVFHIKPIILSLIVLSLGTNLPELSIGIRAIITGDKEVAFGNYIGSAMMNPFILGILTLFVGHIQVSISLVNIVIFTIIAFVFFFYFSKTDNKISRKESLFLLLIYVIFVAVELLGVFV